MVWRLVWQSEVWRVVETLPRETKDQLKKVQRALRLEGPTAFGGMVQSGGLSHVVVYFPGGLFRISLELRAGEIIIVRSVEFFEAPAWP